jgi:hypothetical protein
MHISSITFAAALVLTTINGAVAVVVLSENFDDVISLGNVSNSGTPSLQPTCEYLCVNGVRRIA